jgi:putative hemolysin
MMPPMPSAMSIWVEAVLILLLIVGNALFSGAEIAILEVRKTRLRELKEHGVGAAGAVIRLREQPELFFATVQVGITLVETMAAVLGGATISRALSAALVRFGASPTVAEDISLGVVVAIITYLTVVVGELVPKSLALRSGERFALLAGRPLWMLSRLIRPVVAALTASANLVLKPFRDSTRFSESRFSPRELQQLLDEAATAGTVQPRAAEIASRAIDFQHVQVTALMVARQDMVRIDRNATWEQASKILIDRGHRRVLVSDGDPDHIIGYVTVRDLIAGKQADLPGIQSLVRPIDAVPQTARAPEVLALMQSKRALIALVVDEHGGIAGLVTLDDLVEELVGETFEEHETQGPRIRREGEGSALVEGGTPVHEVNRELGVALPTSPGVVTLAGFVLSRVGGFPRPGVSVDIDHGTRIEVVEATERRVVRARITWTASSALGHGSR